MVRLVSPGSLDGTDWDDVYDELEEGWRAFFHQLRHHLERHRGEDRRTIFLSGRAPARDVIAGVDGMAPGEPWLASRHQRATATGEYGGGLVGVLAARGVDSPEPGRVTVTVTTHGLDDAAYAETRDRWASWWRATAEDPKVTP